jgi:AcrR family transcriptional regulator
MDHDKPVNRDERTALQPDRANVDLIAQPPTGDPSVSTPDTRARGTRLPRTARRSQLLGAAREVFVAQGYHAAAMDEIAERAGVSKPVLYQHFPGKHELYLALIDQHANEIVEAIGRALATTSDNALRAAAAIAAFFEFIDSEGESFRLIFESDLTNDPEVQQRVNWVHERCADAIAGIIAEQTELDGQEAELLGIALGGMAHTAARYWFSKGRRMPREDAIRLVTQLTWRGIANFPRTAEIRLDGDTRPLDEPSLSEPSLSEPKLTAPALAGSVDLDSAGQPISLLTRAGQPAEADVATS